jgi:hypothetical protein
LKVFLTSILKTLVESDDISSVFFYWVGHETAFTICYADDV